MNVKALWAKVQDNKWVLGGLGAAAVVALAWFSRRSATTPAADDTGGAGYGLAAPGATSTTGGYTASAGGAYDSSASDVYNALQPALENVGKQYDELRDLLNKTPVPEAEQPRESLGFFQVRGTPGIYEVFTDNTRRHLGKTEAQERGILHNPAAVNASDANADWSKYRIVPD
ncbi:hypothetical protein [Occultella kanbiaonis]|uniref:hypothetical protein n=1 Tax=Occultella kanbiaonis TaxID=2675754 RepID=UPI0012BA1983|nr:hypothetical protein [Occultella kanbiaonis]